MCTECCRCNPRQMVHQFLNFFLLSSCNFDYLFPSSHTWWPADVDSNGFDQKALPHHFLQDWQCSFGRANFKTKDLYHSHPEAIEFSEDTHTHSQYLLALFTIWLLSILWEVSSRARDIAMVKLKTHAALDKHCAEVYKDLTSNLPDVVSVSLDIKGFHKTCQ